MVFLNENIIISLKRNILRVWWRNPNKTVNFNENDLLRKQEKKFELVCIYFCSTKPTHKYIKHCLSKINKEP